jgi:hypothetical protein
MIASQKDYDVGTAAALVFVEAFIAEKVPGMFESTAQGFVEQMAAPLAKAVIDAVDAERAES